jgi:hypothetical protein
MLIPKKARIAIYSYLFKGNQSSPYEINLLLSIKLALPTSHVCYRGCNYC